jgi:hypothetical protein
MKALEFLLNQIHFDSIKIETYKTLNIIIQLNIYLRQMLSLIFICVVAFCAFAMWAHCRMAKMHRGPIFGRNNMSAT